MQGGFALASGAASIPFFGPLPTVVVAPYGVYQLGTGGARTYRGVKQMTGNNKCHSECTIGGNVKRFATGIGPGRRLLDMLAFVP